MQLNHYRRGHGEPLVLIHGIGSRWQMWEPVIDALVAHRDVIAIDLPGFGASAMPPPGTSPGLDSLVTLVAGFLAQLEVERPHSAGNSLGGLIVLEMARRGLVRSATALSPAGFANRPEMVLARIELRAGVRVARMLAPRAAGVMRSRTGRLAALNLFVAHPTRVPPQAAAADLRGLAHAPWFDATLPTITPMEFADGERIEVPITVAWGDKDRLLPPRQAQRAARLIPSARIVTLPSCGHVPTYDDPARVTTVLLEGSQAT